MKYQKSRIGMILIIIVFMSSCGTTHLYYKTGNHVGGALADNKNPPVKAVPTNLNIDIGNWRLDDLSVSPGGEFLVLAMVNKALDKGKIEIYHQSGRLLKRTISNNEMKNIIESSTNLEYPGSVNVFIPYELGYENDNVLIVHIQPQNRGDSTPEDVELKIDLKTDQLVGTPVFFSRTNHPPFPSHISKNKYNFEVINGEMFVNGNKLIGMPANIDENLHDEVTY